MVWLLVLVTVSGWLAAPYTTLAQAMEGGDCSNTNVYRVNGSSQYPLTFQAATELCQSVGHSLATEEQVISAFNKGLQTCSYGWTQGEKIIFLPNNSDPTCASSAIEVFFHSDAPGSLYVAYCFNASESSNSSCEHAIASRLNTSVRIHASLGSATSAEKYNSDEDILEEASTDGFIVVQNTERPKGDKVISVPENLAQTPNSTTFTNGTTDHLQTGLTDTDMMDNQKPAESTVQPSADVSTQNVNPETVPVTVSPKQKKYLLTRTTTNTPAGESASTSLQVEEGIDGSGSGSESGSGFTDILLEKAFTTTPTPVEKTETESTTPQNTNQNTESTVPVKGNAIEGSFGQRSGKGLFLEPTAAAHAAKKGTPGWLVIFAFVMAVGAVLLILAAVATKDKWYGPSRSSLTITPKSPSPASEKAEMAVKEQEMVSLMGYGQSQQNDKLKDFTVISLEESPEKEHLM